MFVTIAQFVTISYFLISIILVLPFHLNYLLKNFHTKLTVNNISNTIQIKQGKDNFSYYISDIKVYQFIAGHYKSGRSKSWIPIPFDYYGYLLVETNDNKEFYFTSLILNPFKPPLKIDKTFYDYPFILKSKK